METFDSFKVGLTEAVERSFAENNVDILSSTINTITTSEKRNLLDQILREHLHKLVAESPTDIPRLECFITFTIAACRKEWCSPMIPVVFLGDIFEWMTLGECEKLFGYVESGVNVWKEELFFLPCKNNMLRMCNDLLRRLSRSQNTHFCGRILLFLAKFFPFSERSGLNIVSEFNLENVTEHGGDEEGNDVDMKEFSSDAEETKPDTKSTIDYSLYTKFWALQDFFRNPNMCYNKTDWKTFTSHTTHILSAFSSFKLESQVHRSKLAAPAVTAAAPQQQQQQQQQQHYFAKFLTNQKLLELELSDANFRRYILTQYLVVFQYLTSPVKFKSDSQELKSDQREWVKETAEAVRKLIVETPPDGEAYLERVTHVMRREEVWNDWKNKGCPSFRPPAGQSDAADADEPPAEGRKKQPPVRPRRARRRLGEAMQDAAAHNKFIMGNPELTRLWNICPNNLEACKSAGRDFLPTLESYFEEAIQQLDPSAMVEDEYKRVNDGSFGWRALRLLARRSPHFFTHSNNPINKLPEYIETMIRKIARDRPELVRTTPQDIPDTPASPGDNGVEVEVADDGEGEGGEELEVSTPVGKKEEQAVSREMIAAVAKMVGPGWKTLANKLGFTGDLVDVFEHGQSTDYGQAMRMLSMWAVDDEDATPENLVYALEGLGYEDAPALLGKAEN